MSAYPQAIDATTEAIRVRARNYRNMVVVIASTILISLIAALATWSPSPLALLALLVGECGVFLYWDARLLAVWRARVLGPWSQHEIDLLSLEHALRAIPNLPPATLSSMLRTLPAPNDIASEHSISGNTRRAVRVANEFVHGSRASGLLVRAATMSMASLAVVVAAFTRDWMPLLVVALPLCEPLLVRWWRRRRLRSALSQISACREAGDFQADWYEQLAGATMLIKR